MSLTARNARMTHSPEQEDRLANLFHALSQPLTILRCCLDLSLQKPRSAKRYRQDLRVALQQLESATRLVVRIRELVDAGPSRGHGPNSIRPPLRAREPALPLTGTSHRCR